MIRGDITEWGILSEILPAEYFSFVYFYHWPFLLIVQKQDKKKIGNLATSDLNLHKYSYFSTGLDIGGTHVCP